VNGKTEIHLNTIGEHNVMNALAAFAVGEKLGLSIPEIVSGLAKFKPTGLRQNITEKNGIILINDTYNANLSSMKAALDVLASFQQKTGKTVCVLGDMLELGTQSEEIHREVGEYVQKKKISQAFFIGKDAYFIKQGAGFGDWFANKAEFLDFAAKNKTTFENAAILIKASRGMAFEEIAEKIQ
jgi:UDP-N-acetylmuramoyl-tripeptide--D-alanyl-D-alanine ligase